MGIWSDSYKLCKEVKRAYKEWYDEEPGETLSEKCENAKIKLDKEKADKFHQTTHDISRKLTSISLHQAYLNKAIMDGNMEDKDSELMFIHDQYNNIIKLILKLYILHNTTGRYYENNEV